MAEKVSGSGSGNGNGDGQLLLPPGFRFHPTDDELVTHYLLRKCTAAPVPVSIITELDLYKYDPWQLPEKALYGEKEWYFFSPRDRKYPNGSRPNRAAGNGYWKATGADKPIGSPKAVAIKKALVFYSGKAPNGEKTNWIMHEYRVADVDRSARKKNSSLRLDDWVLCRIYHKKGAIGKQTSLKKTKPEPATPPESKPEVISPPVLPISFQSPDSKARYISFDSPESIPWLVGDSSSSGHEHVPSSEDYTREFEVESQSRWVDDWDLERALGLVEFDDGADFGFVPLSPVFRNSFQDTFMNMQETF